MYEQYEGLAEIWEEPGKHYIDAGKEYTLGPIDGKIVSPDQPLVMICAELQLASLAEVH